MLAILTAVLPAITTVLERLFPDPAEREKARLEFMTVFASADLGQLEINKAEAQSPSLFVSGWRPFIGWVGAIALAWQYLIRPLAIMIFSMVEPTIATMLLNAPALDGMLWELIFGILGMGMLRSFDKIKGVAS